MEQVFLVLDGASRMMRLALGFVILAVHVGSAYAEFPSASVQANLDPKPGSFCSEFDNKPDILSIAYDRDIQQSSRPNITASIFVSREPTKESPVPDYLPVQVTKVFQERGYQDLLLVETPDGLLSKIGHSYVVRLDGVILEGNDKPEKNKHFEFQSVPPITLSLGNAIKNGRDYDLRNVIDINGTRGVIKSSEKLTPAHVSLSREDRFGFLQELDVEAVWRKRGPESDVLSVRLKRPLPKAEKSIITGELQVCNQSGSGNRAETLKKLEVADSHASLSVPSERGDEAVKLFVDLSYVDDGTKPGSAGGDALLDLLARKTLAGTNFNSDWYRDFAVLLDARVGSNDPSTSTAANTVRIGVDTQFHRTSGEDLGQGEHRWSLGIAHASDRDMKTRELVAYTIYAPFRYALNRDIAWTAELAQKPVGDKKAKRTEMPSLRAWTLLPGFGIEVGQVLQIESDAANSKAVPTTEGNSFIRGVFALELGLHWRDVVLSAKNTLRYADRSVDNTLNILEVSIAYQVNPSISAGVKFNRGRDAPTFERVDTSSIFVGYRL